jgi:hypothetical protein
MYSFLDTFGRLELLLLEPLQAKKKKLTNTIKQVSVGGVQLVTL